MIFQVPPDFVKNNLAQDDVLIPGRSVPAIDYIKAFISFHLISLQFIDDSISGSWLLVDESQDRLWVTEALVPLQVDSPAPSRGTQLFFSWLHEGTRIPRWLRRQALVNWWCQRFTAGPVFFPTVLVVLAPASFGCCLRLLDIFFCICIYRLMFYSWELQTYPVPTSSPSLSDFLLMLVWGIITCLAEQAEMFLMRKNVTDLSWSFSWHCRDLLMRMCR